MECCTIRDNYQHINSDIEYIIENILFESTTTTTSINEYEAEQFEELKSNYNSILQNSCDCSKDSDCDSTLNNICKHSGNYLKNSIFPELLLNPNRKSKDLIYECTQLCNCGENCNNRLVQFGPNKNLKIVFSRKVVGNHGLISTKFLSNGSFICEYVGEILTKSEAKRRINKLNKTKMNYIICLNEYPVTKNSENYEPLQTFIDPEFKGNIGRYINHSCDPNCEILSVRIDSVIPKLGIFAKSDIFSGEEITFHYGGGQQNNKTTSEMNGIKCYCGSRNCQEYLPNLEF